MITDKKYPEWRTQSHSVDVTNEDYSPNALIQKINDVCDELGVPREDIIIYMEGDDDYCVKLVFHYLRSETEQERNSRLNYETQLEKTERKELARLKAKYENE